MSGSIKLWFNENKKKMGYFTLKSIIFMAFYAILHFLYTILHQNPFFQAIAGTDESVFQHLKIGFFAYLILIGIDYLIVRKEIENVSSFVFSRLISSLLVPWIIFIIWYIVPAFVGHEIGLAKELAWALVVVFITGIMAAVVDDNIETLEFLEAGLSAFGYRIVTAENGIDALKKTDSENPDLILLGSFARVLWRKLYRNR